MRKRKESPHSTRIFRLCKRWYDYNYVSKRVPRVVTPEIRYLIGKNVHNIISQYLGSVSSIPRSRAEIENNVLSIFDKYFDKSLTKQKNTVQKLLDNFIIFENQRLLKDPNDYPPKWVEKSVITEMWNTKIDMVTKSGNIYDWKTDINCNLTADKVFQGSIYYWAAKEKFRAEKVYLVFLRKRKDPSIDIPIMEKKILEEMWLEINSCNEFPSCFGTHCFSECPFSITCEFEGANGWSLALTKPNEISTFNKHSIFKGAEKLGFS